MRRDALLAGFPGAKAACALMLALLAGCSNNADIQDLSEYVEQQVNRPPGPIEPLPEFVSYEPFTYSAAGMRSPFEVPVDIASAVDRPESEQVQPDENRPREALEEFNLGNLTMVGSLARGNTMWGLVQDPEGTVHRVTRGNYMGRNHGRVVAISEDRLELVEIVPSGDGGWIERPQTVTLQGREQ